MDETATLDLICEAMETVPVKHLMIIDLAHRFNKGKGELDYEGLSKIQPEVNLAIIEAKMYGAHTLQAVDALLRLEAIPADV